MATRRQLLWRCMSMGDVDHLPARDTPELYRCYWYWQSWVFSATLRRCAYSVCQPVQVSTPAIRVPAGVSALSLGCRRLREASCIIVICGQNQTRARCSRFAGVAPASCTNARYATWSSARSWPTTRGTSFNSAKLSKLGNAARFIVSHS